MQKSILPIVLLPSLALALTACGSSEPPTIVIATPSASPQAQYKQADGNLSQELEKAQNELKALNEKLAALQSQEAPAASADTQTDTQTDTKADTKADAQASNAPAAGTVVGASDTPKANPAAQASANAPATDTGASAPKPNEGQPASGTAPANTAPSAPDASAPKGQPTGVAAPTDSSATTPKESAPTTPKQTQPDGPSGAPANTQDGGASVPPAQGSEPPKAAPSGDASGTPTTVTPGGDGHTTVQPGSPVGGSSGADLGATDPAPKESVPPATSPEVISPAPTKTFSEVLTELNAKFNPERDTKYEAIVVTLDPSQSNKVVGEIIENPKKTMDELTIGSTTIKLLTKPSDKKIKLREMTADDFLEGALHPENKSIIGSKEGSKYNAFGELRYGVYNVADGKSHLFVYGNGSSGTNGSRDATYLGNAIIGKDGKYKALEKAVTAKLDVATSNLDIVIKVAQGDELKFNANFNKDKKTFFGDGDNVKTQGGLFGYNELGGIFDVVSGNHQGENGVFGASSDEDIEDEYLAP